MTNKKIIVVVEDRASQRVDMVTLINNYGFHCLAGDTLAETYDILQERWQDISVVVLDMYLEEFKDYQNFGGKTGPSKITGAELMKMTLATQAQDQPETIVLSAFTDRISYYKQALKIDAAKFLKKNDDRDSAKLIPYIQILSLRHSFSERVLSEADIARTVGEAKNPRHLLSSSFVGYMLKHLDICFQPATYVLLVRIKNSPDSVANNDDYSQPRVISQMAGLPSPVEFDYLRLHNEICRARRLPYDITAPDEKPAIFKNLLFTRLVVLPEIEISIGFLRPFPLKHRRFSFETATILEFLNQYLSPTLERHVKRLIFLWNQEEKLRAAKVHTLMKLNDAVINQLNGLMPIRGAEIMEHDSALPNQLEESSLIVDKLMDFRRQLSDYSDNLAAIIQSSRARTQTGTGKKISEIIGEINDKHLRNNYVLGPPEEDCVVPCNDYYFSLALRKILQWISRRLDPSSATQIPPAEITWTIPDEDGEWLEFRVRDFGERSLFIKTELDRPFSPLYVAKLFIEVSCQGRFIEATEDLEGEAGHLFKIRLFNY